MLLFLSTVAALSLQAEGSHATARIEVASGRAVLVQRGDRGSVLAAGDELTVAGAAHLVVGAGGVARASWLGVASLRLVGPVEIDWRNDGVAASAASGEEPSDAGSLEWTVVRSGEIDVEVRRGTPRLDLPSGWFARLGAGSYHVDADASERPRFAVRAGEPVRLFREDPSGRVRPPVEVAAGELVRLSADLVQEPRPDRTALAAPWPRTILPSVWSEPDRAPGAARDVALQIGVASEPPRVTLELPRREIAAEPLAEPPTEPPAEPRPELAPMDEPEIELPVAPARATRVPKSGPFVAQQWHGLERSELRPLGPGAVQTARGLRAIELGSGRWHIALPWSAQSPVWFLGEARDTRIWPGASITVDREGFLQAYQGWVRVRSAPADRPRLADLEP